MNFNKYKFQLSFVRLKTLAVITHISHFGCRDFGRVEGTTYTKLWFSPRHDGFIDGSRSLRDDMVASWHGISPCGCNSFPESASIFYPLTSKIISFVSPIL